MKEEKVFRLNWMSFLAGILLGIFYVYISSPQQKKIIKYPNPYNAGKLYYKNEDGTCYKYKAEEAKCDSLSLQQPLT